MPDIAKCVSDSVVAVSSTITALSNNKSDEKKAVNAAKSAGNKAKKLAEKLYPNWDTKGTKEMARKEGIDSRAEWKRARASAGQQAYDDAYDEVWLLYQKVVESKVNATNFQNSQETLDKELEMAQMQSGYNNKSMSSGCAPVVAISVVSSILMYLLKILI